MYLQGWIRRFQTDQHDLHDLMANHLLYQPGLPYRTLSCVAYRHHLVCVYPFLPVGSSQTGQTENTITYKAAGIVDATIPAFFVYNQSSLIFLYFIFICFFYTQKNFSLQNYYIFFNSLCFPPVTGILCYNQSRNLYNYSHF